MNDTTPSKWPADKLAALRNGQRLVAEIPASGLNRRAFVNIRPITTAADAQAQKQGWTRADHNRSFSLEHWDYDTAQIAGFDYDAGATLVKTTTAANEAKLIAALKAWGLRPDHFTYPWQTDDPE